MILSNKITVRVAPATLKYWSNLGYISKVGEKIDVNISELPKHSNIYVDCKCDKCNRNYQQRISRNTNVCGYCLSSLRMKGNKLNKNNIKYDIPSKKELLDHIEQKRTKKYLCDLYKVSFPVINRWFKYYNIVLPKHFGKLFFKTEDEKNIIINQINSIKSNNSSISEISRQLNIPRYILKDLTKNNNINLETQFDVWKKAYNNIVLNLPFYVQENKKKNLKIISEENNISIEQLKKAFRENNIDVKLHSYNKSKGEIECTDYINSLGEQCHSAMLDKIYEIDCYVPKKKFGVEYCGEFWHKFEEDKQNKYYHRNKMNFARDRGIHIVTIFESEWLLKKDIVKSIIKTKLGHANRIYARKTICKEILKSVAEEFHEKNHLSGYTNSSINFGLYHGNTLVSVLSFIKSRFDKKYEYEISRFSTIQNHLIVGGLSKMFNAFVTKYKPKSCMTYSDLRLGEGKSYMKIGFKRIDETIPNYYYYHKKKGYLEPRMRYQKHKLQHLKSYSITKTEIQIMQEDGYYILYDCGNVKYGWKI